jgi:hypothetical protein
MRSGSNHSSGQRTCCPWGHARQIENWHLDRMIDDLDEAADLSTAKASR